MLGRELCRGLIIQCAVRPMLVVVPAPGGDQDTSLWQARKPIVIQALISEASIEALDERVLRGFPGLDQFELNAMLAGPLVERFAGKFWSLVSSNGLGVAPEASRLIKNTSNVMA